MNWGMNVFRSAKDRCSPTFQADPKHPLAASFHHGRLGGNSYSGSCFDQSVIIIDEGIQNPEAAEVTGYDVTGPVQFVQAKSDKHFPGTVITRTFALLGPHGLIVDRVTGKPDQPHTIDWVFLVRDVKLSVPLEERQGSWTKKGAAYGSDVKSHRYAKTDGTFSNGGSQMTVLGEPGTEVITYPCNYVPNAIMLRRRNVTETDYAALFFAEAQSFERLPVKTAAGKAAQAVGLKITLKDGKVFHVIVNYEPAGTEVALGDLKTKERFGTDYPK
jgi:hypothetical protein